MSRLVLLSGFAFVWWLIRMDMRWRQLPSKALWVPALWLAQSSSRSIGFWLAAMGIGSGGASNLEGNSINSIFNASLFLIAILILRRRQFRWAQFFGDNKAVILVFLFFFLSTAWSEFPIPTVKRLTQEFGSVLIAPVLITELNPSTSFRIVFARVSYLLFPISVVLIRYFPNVGRNISSVSGNQMVCGVADHKNSLGQLVMVFLLVLIWDFVETRKDGTSPQSGMPHWARFINFAIGLYLLFLSASATALMCFILGLFLFFTSGRLAQVGNPKRLLMASAFLMVCILTINQRYHLTGEVSKAMGRGEGLTGRTEIWDTILEKQNRPFLGFGFRGFWETPEGMSVAEELHTNRLVSSHNGYLEIYVQGGFVGLFFLLIYLFATGIIAADKLVSGDPFGRMAILFWPILLLYNLTESAYFQVGTLWFTFLIVTVFVRNQNARAGEEVPPDHQGFPLVTDRTTAIRAEIA